MFSTLKVDCKADSTILQYLASSIQAWVLSLLVQTVCQGMICFFELCLAGGGGAAAADAPSGGAGIYRWCCLAIGR